MTIEQYANRFVEYFQKFIIESYDDCVVTNIKLERRDVDLYYVRFKTDLFSLTICINDLAKKQKGHTVEAVAEYVNVLISNQYHEVKDKHEMKKLIKNLINSTNTSIDLEFEYNDGIVQLPFDNLGYSYVLKADLTDMDKSIKLKSDLLDYIDSEQEFTNLWSNALYNTYRKTVVEVTVLSQPNDIIKVDELEYVENDSTMVFEIKDKYKASKNFFLLLTDYYEVICDKEDIDKFYILPNTEYSAQIYGVLEDDEETKELINQLYDIDADLIYVYNRETGQIELEDF